MKLYIVQTCNRILGVFTTREAAELTKDAYHARYMPQNFSAHILEIDLREQPLDFKP